MTQYDSRRVKKNTTETLKGTSLPKYNKSTNIRTCETETN